MDSSIGIKKNDEIVINIPVGARTFGFAYPCSIGEVSKVEYVEVNDSSMKDNFDVSTFEYVLPNGSTEQYYLYSYTMAVGAMAKMTMKVTL